MVNALSQTNRYRRAVERYLAARQPTPPWPHDAAARSRQIQRVPWFVPALAGLPKDCLPLLLFLGGRGLIGMLTDLRVLTAEVVLLRNQAEGLRFYSGFNAMFTQNLALYDPNKADTEYHLRRAVYLIDAYRDGVGQLRKFYPDLAPLFVDPPPISAQLRETFEISEAWACSI